MPFAPHVRVTALGRLGSASGERFSYGFNMAKTSVIGGEVPVDETPGLWQDIAADIVAFHSATGPQISNQAVLESVKFANIGADGKYTRDPFSVDVTDTPGGGGSIVAPQLALAISLTTDRRGPTGKGRFYLPMPTHILQSTNLAILEEQRDNAQAAAATFLSAVNNQPGLDVDDFEIVVSSTKGYNTKVTGVRVGRTLDTIRSRRRQLSEAFDAPTALT